MGMEWTLGGTETGEAFILDKGPWGSFSFAPRNVETFVSDAQAAWKAHCCRHEVGRVWWKENEAGALAYMADVARRLHAFCVRHDWSVTLMNDSYGDELFERDWRIVDSRIISDLSAA